MLLEAGRLSEALEAFQAAAVHRAQSFSRSTARPGLPTSFTIVPRPGSTTSQIVQMCRDTSPGRAVLAFARKQLL